jgi:hypothetical protein
MGWPGWSSANSNLIPTTLHGCTYSEDSFRMSPLGLSISFPQEFC